jgi:PAS domain S-box-containing protein
MRPTSPASPDGSVPGDLTAINRAILDTALDCIITMDQTGIVREFNPAAERVFGFTRSEAVGKELAELIVPPALRTSHRRGLAHYLATGEGPVLGRRIEINALRRDGSEILVELAITPYQIEGTQVFTAYLRDITERVRTEKRRAAQYAVASLLAGTGSLAEVGLPLLETMAASGDWSCAAIWLHDEGGATLHCATTWHAPGDELAKFTTASRSFHFRKGEGLPGRVWETKKATWIADVTNDPNFPRAAIAREANLRGGFAFALFADNSVNGIIEMFSHSPVQPDDDLLQLVEAIGIQIGLFIERRRIEQELKREKESAESANAAKDRFLAMLSHELRTPLTPVLIWAGGTINEPDISPEIRNGLKMICRNVELESRLIDDMLDLTRITRGKLNLQLGRADVHDLVRHAIEIVGSDVESRHLKLSVALTAARREVMVDAPRLQQVFWNVFRNACKFTSQNGEVTVHSFNPDEKTIVVEISDNGIGIAPEFIDKVFEAFEQGDTRREGLGLGMAISKLIVEMHGGRIEARSEGTGLGAAFLITLPLVQTDSSASG